MNKAKKLTLLTDPWAMRKVSFLALLIKIQTPVHRYYI